MKFKDFIQSEPIHETGTSTGDVAGFSRIAIPMVSRMWPNNGTTDSKKKKTYRVPQLDD